MHSGDDDHRRDILRLHHNHYADAYANSGRNGKAYGDADAFPEADGDYRPHGHPHRRRKPENHLVRYNHSEKSETLNARVRHGRLA